MRDLKALEQIPEWVSAKTANKVLTELWHTMWVRYVLTHIFSKTWDERRNQAWTTLRHQGDLPESITQQDFADTVLAAQLNTFQFITAKVSFKLYVLVDNILMKEFYPNLSQERSRKIDEAISLFTQKIVQYGVGGVPAHKSITRAIFEQLRWDASPRIAKFFEVTVSTLGHVWWREATGKRDYEIIECAVRQSFDASSDDEELALTRTLTALFLSGFPRVDENRIGCLICGQSRQFDAEKTTSTTFSIPTTFSIYVISHTQDQGCAGPSSRWIKWALPGMWGWRGRMLKNRNH
jgi:hypothetical protein